MKTKLIGLLGTLGLFFAYGFAISIGSEVAIKMIRRNKNTKKRRFHR